MTEPRHKFKTVLINNKACINGCELLNGYKTTSTKVKITKMSMKTFVTEFNLQYIMKPKGKSKITDIEGYRYNSHYIYIILNKISVKILDLIKKENKDVANATNELNEEVKAEYTNTRPEIITLEEHEMFLDENNNPFDIEVCGERSPYKIYFKLKDIARYFDMENLQHVIINKDNTYTINEDYCEFTSHESCLVNPKPYKYLTFTGLIKVIYTSRVGNSNRIKLRDWVNKLAYDAKFGSDEERMNRAENITSHISNEVLNTVSGLYLIDIGLVKDLRNKMDISYEDYPVEYDTARIKKFGVAKDIFKRLKQHKNKYNIYSSDINLDWFINIPESTMYKAESTLNEHYEKSGLKFTFKDKSELVIVNSTQTKELKAYYSKLVKWYPNKINEVTTLLTTKHENDLLKKEIELEKMRSQVALKNKDIEILMLKLKLCERNN